MGGTRPKGVDMLLLLNGTPSLLHYVCLTEDYTSVTSWLRSLTLQVLPTSVEYPQKRPYPGIVFG